MKISLEQYGVKYTIEDECDGVSICEAVDHLYGLLLNAGYSPNTVADAFIDKGEEMQTHPVTEPTFR